MRTVLIFVAGWLVSTLAGIAVAIKLAYVFNSREEFVAVLFVLLALSCISLCAFAAVYLMAKRRLKFDYVALGLAAFVLIVEELPALSSAFAARSFSQFVSRSPYDVAIAAELLSAAAVIIVLQWAVIRWRWVKLHPRWR